MTKTLKEPPPKRNTLFLDFTYGAMKVFFFCLSNLMYRVRSENLEKIPAQGGVLLLCNHVSYVDWAILGPLVSRPVHFIVYFGFTKGGFLKGVLMNAFVKFGKGIPIASVKENPEILQKALENAASELRRGNVVCIFPEGTLTWDGKLGVFRSGYEKILELAPVPVVPLALVGFWGSWFSRHGGIAILKRPRRFRSMITLKAGDPLNPESANVENVKKEIEKLLQS
jgi:1-acyl-sn-glycerol-3-phosphate acyltransferase